MKRELFFKTTFLFQMKFLTLLVIAIIPLKQAIMSTIVENI